MVNQLPQGWKKEELGKLGVATTGGTPSKSNSEYYGSDVLWVKPSELKDFADDPYIIDTPEKLSIKGAEKVRKVPKGSVLICCIGSIGKMGIASCDIRTNQQINSIKFFDNVIDDKLGFYACYFKKNEFIQNASNAVVPILNKTSFEKIKIIYPTDKGEQKYIVDTLDAVAEMIKLRKETIDLTKKLIPAIFQEMFGDPNIEDVNYVPFNQFFVVVNNEKKEIKSEDYRTKADGLLPVVDQGKKEIVAYTEQLDKKISAHDNPIILFGDHTREVKFIDFDFVVGADGTQLMRTVEGVEPLFAFWQLKMKHIESKGYSRHFKYVKAMKFLIADNTKQKEFAKKVEQINQNLEVQQKDLDRLQELFDQLLQKAFTGELTRGEAYGII